MEKQNNMLFDVNEVDLKTLKNNPKKFWNDVQVIGYECFANCKDLKEVELPKDVWNIGSSAFKNCENLEILKINSNFISVASDAFSGCTRLSKIIFLGPVERVDFKIENFGNLKYFAINSDGHVVLCSDFVLGEYDEIITLEELHSKLFEETYESSSESESSKDLWRTFLWSLFGVKYGPYGDVNSNYNSELYIPVVSFVKRLKEFIEQIKK